MFEKILIFGLSLLSIDVYNILYKAYMKIWLKRINLTEKTQGFENEQLTTLEDISSDKPTIIYGLSSIFVSFYVVFFSDMLTGTFFENVLTNFEAVILPLLIYLSFSVIWKYIKGFFDFAKGFKESLVDIEDENIIYEDESEAKNENE
jgi:hypothetical protein